jgi:hypothetical protein
MNPPRFNLGAVAICGLVSGTSCSTNDDKLNPNGVDQVNPNGVDQVLPVNPNATDRIGVHLNGAVQKGPFIVGSTIQVSNLNARTNPTGAIF